MGTEEWVNALRQPGFWPQPGPVESLETHISWIFLVGDRAYKVKKPVDLGFADFTTLEQRRFFCEEELRLNRRLAPELYLGVRTITGTAARPRLDGAGEPIDFAVEMRRFDQADLLVNVARAGKLEIGHIDRLAAAFAAFHQRADRADPDSRFGTPDGIARAADDNFADILRANPPPGRQQLLRHLRSWTRHENDRLHEHFERRRAAGKIREGHGDLHLGNIILSDGQITIFDCIEFNADFRWIDVLNDVAFCAMDLTRRAAPHLSHQFLNTYLEQTGDYEGMAVLPYYLAYRAAVRAKVAWLKEKKATEEAPGNFARECMDYLSLAEQYASRPPPRLLVMHGVSGTGKSFGSAEILRRTGAIRIRSDVERKRIAAATGETELYTPAMTDRTYARLRAAADSCLRAGFSVILDAAYLEEQQRSAALAVAENLGAPARILHLTATRETLEERIVKRDRETADPSDADVRVLKKQLGSREPLTGAEQAIAVHVDTEQADCWADAIHRLNDRLNESGPLSAG